jgi:hypothetical protein
MASTRTVRRRSTGSGVVGKLLQFLSLKDEVKTTTERLDALKKDLTQHVVEYGETDDKGHRNFVLPAPLEYGDKSYTGFQQQRRVSQSFDTEVAEKLLKDKNLWERATVVVREIDQNEVYVLNQEGLITDAELDSMFNERETFAFRPISE